MKPKAKKTPVKRKSVKKHTCGAVLEPYTFPEGDKGLVCRACNVTQRVVDGAVHEAAVVA